MKHLTATICLTIAVLLGSVGVSWSADFQKGLTAYERGDYTTALRELKPLAVNKGAQSLLYSKKNVIKAQFLLGWMYHEGKGVPKDDKTAVKWYRLAAEQGHADAQISLGAMYAFGTGVLKDYVYTHMWGNIAATNGNTLGAKLRNHFEKKMTPTDISTAQKLARECIRKKYKGC